MYIQMSAKEGQNIHVKITEVAIHAANITDSGEFGHIVDEGVEKSFAYSRNSKGNKEAEFKSTSHMITLALDELNKNLIISYLGRL